MIPAAPDSPRDCTCPTRYARLVAVVDGRTRPVRTADTLGPTEALHVARCSACRAPYTGHWRLDTGGTPPAHPAAPQYPSRPPETATSASIGTARLYAVPGRNPRKDKTPLPKPSLPREADPRVRQFLTAALADVRLSLDAVATTDQRYATVDHVWAGQTLAQLTEIIETLTRARHIMNTYAHHRVGLGQRELARLQDVSPTSVRTWADTWRPTLDEITTGDIPPATATPA